jgi:hypothetical protein
MGYCSSCGKELLPTANFCTNCGAVQTKAEVVQTEMFEQTAVEPATIGSSTVEPSVFAGAGSPSVHPQKIENHLVKSVVATLCCCVPFGVAGIVYAAQVDSLLRQGDRSAAEEASRKAGMWSNLAIGVGLVVNVLATVLTVVYQFREGVYR